MASMVNGEISGESVATLTDAGEFQRAESAFREQILKSEAVPGRFHLYVSYACPWAHRTLIARAIKKLEGIVEVSVTDAFMGEKGWTFAQQGDPKYLAVLYVATDKKYTGKISVPVLWDNQEKRIKNNESSDILRLFNSSFDHLTESNIDLAPDELLPTINAVNDTIYQKINNGVYKTGLASTQSAYEKAFMTLFETLDEMDDLLAEKPYLAGNYFTEADIRFFTTLIRFDAVYYTHFKCNLRRISDYHNLYNYLKAIYQTPEIKATCHFDHIKEHYFKSHKSINPSGIVPLGPALDLESEHNRGELQFWRKHH